MSFIKRLDDISGTETRSKNLSEAIAKCEEAMNALKSSKKQTTKSNKSKGEVEEA